MNKETDWPYKGQSKKLFKILCLKRKKFWGSSSSSYGPQSQSRNNGINLNSSSLSVSQIGTGGGGSSGSTLSLGSDSTTDKNGRGSRGSFGGMAPPPATQAASAPAVHPAIREVTEDTPPDLLEGTMELLIVLPSTKTVRMTIDRRTPMMDLLIQVGTVNKLNPGDHIVQVRNERGIELPYKPSTPIGALDTTTIEIVPKNRVNEYIIVKKPAKLANQPFEQTFRLQVHLPRNQLYVMRTSSRTLLEDILKEVCQEKNLDILKYEIRHPAKLEEKLPLNNTLGDFGLQEVTVVSKNTRINSSVSSADIMAMQQTEEARAKGYLDSSFKHSRSSVGDSSVSSGSTGSARGLSPTRSDDSRSVSPLAHIHSKSKLTHRTSTLSSCSSGIASTVQKSSSVSNMFSPPDRTASLPAGVQAPPRTKKRAAPLPPPLVKSQTESALSLTSSSNSITSPVNPAPIKPTPRKKEAPRVPPQAKSFDSPNIPQSVPTSTHSRHSSGSSGYHESSVLSDQTEGVHRFDRQSSVPAMLSKQVAARSTSNLTTVSSVSTTSLASSTGGSKKRRAPPPPAVVSLQLQSEIEEEDSESSSSVSHHGLVSSKSDKSRQSSVEVEVDVHHRQVSRQASSQDHSSSTPISVNELKDMEMLSSSPASSLSSPGSSSGSTSSSPLPRTESPNSKPALNNNSSHSSSTANVSSSSRPSNYYPEVDDTVPGPSGSFSSVEEPPGRSTVSPGSTQAAAPLPPPRTKSREVLHATTTSTSTDDPSLVTHPQPRPKPKPRPDRISVDNLISDNPSIIKPKSVDSPIPPQESTPIMTTQLRNPMAKYGVKVLPDNVIKERAERLAQKAASVESNDSFPDTNNYVDPPKKSVAPPPPTFKKSTPQAQIQNRKKNSDASYSSSASSDNILGESMSSESLNTKLKKENPLSKTKQIESSQDLSSTEYDSDNLEENLEFFEPNPTSRKKTLESKLAESARKPGLVKQLSSMSTNNSSFDKQKSSISSQESSESRERPIPKPKSKPKPSVGVAVLEKPHDNVETSHKSRVVSASVSAIEDIDREKKVSSSRGISDFEDSKGLTRTHSDRIIKSKEGFQNSESKNSSSSGKLLNRWQNLVSLNEIDDKSEINNASNSNATKTNATTTNKSNNSTKTVLQPSRKGKASAEGFHENDDDEGRIRTVHDDHDDAGNTSSESEVSYTDSGIPATEPVTPSPMDFDRRISDHEDDGGSSDDKSREEKTHDSRGSSPTSSFHSNDEDQWRNVMEAKSMKSHEDMEKTFASMMPEVFDDSHNSSTLAKTEIENEDTRIDFVESELAKDVSKDKIGKEIKSSFDDTDSGAEDGEEHISSTSEGELLDDEMKNNKRNSDTTPTRKLSKSESFSHNSEFDFIKMKRKKYAAGHGMKSDGKRGNSTVDLRRSSHHSSSEEDLRPNRSHEKNQKNRIPGSSNESSTDNIKDHRTTSMHNLTTGSNRNTGEMNKNGQKSLGNGIDMNPSIQKATSLLQLEPEVASNPDMMKAFHTQLEAQFEQWKQDFLRKHLTGADVPNSDKDNAPTVSVAEDSQSHSQVKSTHLDETGQTLIGTDATESVTLSTKDIPVIVDEHSKENQIANIPKSEVDMIETRDQSESKIEDLQSSSSSESDDDEPPPIIPSPPVIKDHSVEAELDKKTESASDFSNAEKASEMREEVEVRNKKEPEKPRPAPTYRYTGPPTISMGSWTDRGPRANVVVKKDQDYIMGFGQADPKSAPVESRPLAPSKSIARVSSYQSPTLREPTTPVLTPTPKVTPTVQAPEAPENKTSSLPSIVKGLSATLNARPVSSESNESQGTVKNVLSAWKQRVEGQKDLQTNKGPPPEIDIYGTESSDVSINQPQTFRTVVNSLKKDPKVEVKSTPVVIIDSTKSLPFDSKVNVNASKLAFNGPNKLNEEKTESTISTLKKNSINQENIIVKRNDSFVKQTNQHVKIDGDRSANNSEIVKSTKPMVFSMSAMESKPVIRGKPVVVEVTTTFEDCVDKKEEKVITPVISNDDDTGPSLKDRRKFFQGVSPVESNGKETPLPAVNMKSSIATIQKVFEQRKLMSNNKEAPVVQRSTTLPSHSHKDLNNPTVNLPVPSSTIPKNFQTMSSSEMVQRVIGKPSGFSYDNFRRSPSPVSSTTSTLSRTSSSGRGTPFSSVTDGPDNVVRISSEFKKAAPSPPSTIQNVGNKAIITVNGSDKSDNSNGDVEIKRTNSVSNNIFKQQLKINSSAATNFTNKLNSRSSESSSTKIIINGNDSRKLSQSSVEVQDVSRASSKAIIVEQKVKEAPAIWNKIPQQSVPVKRDSVDGGKLRKSSVSSVSIPPPPPPSIEGLNLRPTGLAMNGKSKSVSSLTANKSSTPTSPSSSDPRAEIFSMIKNSNGNFGLKKTGSTFLLTK